MRTTANFNKLDTVISSITEIGEQTLQVLIDELQEEIDDLEDKQSERETEARQEKINKLGDARYAVQSALDSLENVTQEIADARDWFSV